MALLNIHKCVRGGGRGGDPWNTEVIANRWIIYGRIISYDGETIGDAVTPC